MGNLYRIELTNKVIIITGGYGHLGKAISESLAFHGATVFVMGRTKSKFISAFSDSSPEIQDRIKFISGDVSCSKSINKAFEYVFNHCGKINVLINNAAFTRGQSPTHMTDEDFNFGVDGCLSSVFRCIREVIPFFKDGGKIINVSSMYGVVAPDFELYMESPEFLNPPHYGAAKAGILQLTRYYASFLGKDQITVNSVTPGPFPTSTVQKDYGFVERLKKRTVLNRIGRPEDLGGVFAFLSSDAANFITGQNIVVDGGWTIK